MKNLKLIFSIFLSFLVVEAFALPIVSVHKSGGKGGGGGGGVTYDSYTRTLCEKQGVVGWCITCKDRGNESCNVNGIPPGQGSSLDATDAQYANSFLLFAEGEISSGNISGNYSESIEVNGVTRVYTVTWSNVGGEEGTTEIVVDRTDS